MPLDALFELLKGRFGPHADPDTWWPIFYGRTDPPEFERVITNILVQNASWRSVPQAVEKLEDAALLTAPALAHASEETIAACARPTGLQLQKATRLKRLGTLVVDRFGSEAAFCAGATLQDLRQVGGIGEQTADRILLYTCGRLAWPVDTYCRRVFAHYGLIPPASNGTSAGYTAVLIKNMVSREMPPQLDDWRRLHALMQLEGERLRKQPEPPNAAQFGDRLNE